MADFNSKKMGTAFVVTQIIMEIVHTDREEVHRKIDLARDLANWVHSMVEEKDTTDVGIIDDAIDEIEDIRKDYRPEIDTSIYNDQRPVFEKHIADVLQSIYKIINKYDLIDPNGIIEGKAYKWGAVQEKDKDGVRA